MTIKLLHRHFIALLRRVVATALTVFALNVSAWAGDVVRIGERTLSSDDFSLRQRVELAYRGDHQPVTSATAAVILLQEALAGEVARSLGVDATTTECEAMAAHADATSQAPELLENVKAVFGADRSAYLRLYIAPKVTEENLHVYFVHNRELHKVQIHAIEAAFGEARATSVPLASLAPHYQLEYTTFSLSEAETTGPQEVEVHLDFRKDPLLELVRPLQPGEMFHNIVENDQEFRIVRLISHAGMTTHTLESLVARKHPYDEWYREQAALVPIVFFDSALAGDIRNHYPSLPWWPQVTVRSSKTNDQFYLGKLLS